MIPLLRPDWPAPSNVISAFSGRLGGVSKPPYDSLNLGDHVGDAPAAVRKNRQIFADQLGCPPERMAWLTQVHGTKVVSAEQALLGPVEADASVTSQENTACVIMTADCLPVLFCNTSGTRVAAAHAGWRGLLSGVLTETLAAFPGRDEVMACIGPGIGRTAFEVGEDVLAAAKTHNPSFECFFQPSPWHQDRYLADLPAMAASQLQAQGNCRVFQAGRCTHSHPEDLFSYRRDGQTGRQAALIYLSKIVK